MKKLASVLVLLCVVGTGRTGEKEILERLKEAGVGIVRDKIFGEEDVLAVGLKAGNIEAALPELCELQRLRSLWMKNPSLTDAQMRAVCGQTWLRTVWLDGSAVTDAHLKQVARLRGLKLLSLSGTHVTDAGTKELAVLTELEELWLDGTAVTDAGLRHLERLNKLEFLYLNNCPGVTDEGVARLQKALPKCKINR
jgi:internalin A